MKKSVLFSTNFTWFSILSFLLLLNHALIAQVTIPFSDDFELAEFDTSAWRLRPNLTGQNGLIEIQNNTTCGGGQFLAVIGKSQGSDGPSFTRNGLDLKLKLAGKKDVKLTFIILDTDDENNPQDGLFFSDNNGATFKQVLRFYPDDWCGSCGSYPPINVDSLAHVAGLNLNDQFVIRFQQFDNADFFNSNFQQGERDGYFIDNVKVYSRPNFYANLPFSDGFESGQLGPNWSHEWADSTAKSAIDPKLITLTDNTVRPNLGSGFQSQYGIIMGKNCDENFQANALDLHLNLSGQTNVKLTFDIYSAKDESNDLDAIFFSDDGGLTFKRVFLLNPGNWCSESWGKFPPLNVDELASKYGLSFTSKFVIRFQQYDNADFNDAFGQGERDGFTLDNIRVFSAPISFQSVPFTDDFLTNVLGPQWSWEFADKSSAPDTVVTRIDNLMRLVAGGPTGSQYAIQMGKDCEGNGFNSNALDLHLNLALTTNVNLTYKIFNRGEEQHIQDSIFFSNDGGKKFRGVESLDWSTIPQSQWVQKSLNISNLANAIGVSLTDSFVVRFQQFDNADFFDGFSQGDADGIYLDEFSVTGTPVTGIKSLINSDVVIYPNPATSSLTIQSQNPIQSMELTDLAGHILSVNSNKKNILDFRDLSPGIYWLRVQTAEGVSVQKIVKE